MLKHLLLTDFKIFLWNIIGVLMFFVVVKRHSEETSAKIPKYHFPSPKTYMDFQNTSTPQSSVLGNVACNKHHRKSF